MRLFDRYGARALQQGLGILCVVVALCVLASGCGNSDRAAGARPATGDPADSTDGTDTTASGASGGTASTHTTDARARVGAERLCRDALAEVSGTISDPELGEISGVVTGWAHPGALWVHNDSGAPSVLWAVDPTGAVLGHFTVQGAENVDWEDIAIGTAPSGDQAPIYLADIGDNFGTTRPNDDPPTIYRLPEPADLPAGSAEATAGPAEAFVIAYPDGAHDAEALVADPLTGEVFIVTKQWDGTPAGLYAIPAEIVGADAAPGAPVTVQRAADVSATAGILVTGADISRDGTMIALRSYGDVLLWDRDPGHSVAETLAKPPACSMPIVERQGEAVAFDPDGLGLVTIGEGEGASVNRLRVPAG